MTNTFSCVTIKKLSSSTKAKNMTDSSSEAIDHGTWSWLCTVVVSYRTVHLCTCTVYILSQQVRIDKQMTTRGAEINRSVWGPNIEDMCPRRQGLNIITTINVLICSRDLFLVIINNARMAHKASLIDEIVYSQSRLDTFISFYSYSRFIYLIFRRLKLLHRFSSKKIVVYRYWSLK